MEVYVDDEAKLTLHGLQQHYIKLKENEKNKKLFELLDILEFNQVSIFQSITTPPKSSLKIVYAYPSFNIFPRLRDFKWQLCCYDLKSQQKYYWSRYE